MQSEFERLIQINPWEKPGSFLFFSSIESKPIEGKLVSKSLYAALEEIGINDEVRREKNITFHSWRHWFNSLLINAKVPLQKIQSITGHLTDKMTQHYYHVHAGEMDDIKDIQESIFIG